MDVWEANSMATTYKPHTCGIEGLYWCREGDGTDCVDNDKGQRYEGVCDKDNVVLIQDFRWIRNEENQRKW